MTGLKQKGLSKKERLFVFEYLADEKMNPERAAIKAGYSATVARTKAYVWVSKSKQNEKPQIAEMVDELIKKREAKLEISSEKIINEVVKIAFFDISKVIEKIEGKEELTLEELKKISPDLLAGVSEIAIDKGTVRIKIPWKFKALELLGKKFKLWEGTSEGVKYVLEVLQGSAEN